MLHAVVSGRLFWGLALVQAGLVFAACGGGDEPGGTDSGIRRIDSGVGDSGTRDGATRDARDACDGVVCGMFERCDMGTCRAYRGCVASTMCAATEICLHRFCIPRDADPDGDGHPAGTDCDETSPDINPGATEVCNLIDDDCNGMVDDGDPGALCAMDPSGGICIDGGCGCPGGTFDLDRDPTNGCECSAMPMAGQGATCGSAIDLGEVSDLDMGQTLSVSGNVLPDDREVWYTFRSVDSPDTMCDNYHVRVQFMANPGDAFAITVFRGDCTTVPCMDELYTDFSWATDFFTPGMGMAATGQCPCAPSTANVTRCADDSAPYFVRVVRRPGTMVSCDAFALEITNGVYDTM